MAAKDTVTKILITAKDEASSVFTSLSAHAGKIAATIATYFSAKLFGDSVAAAEALDGQMRKLEGVIAATGGAAGLTAEEIDAMARRLDEATLGSAAGFRDAAAQLLTFKSVGKDAFETTLLLAQDLADAGFGSVTSNAVQLGKALEDPVKGLTALTRSGVTFTENQQAVIKSLVETGRAADAQKIILEAVAGQVGGTAAAMGGGLSGAIDLVGKRFTDLKEQLGSAILPVFTEFNNRLADLYKRLTDSGAVKTFGEAIASAFQSAQDAFFRFFDNFDLDSIIVSLKSWATTTKETVEQWGQYLSTASDVASTAFNAIATGFNVIKTGALSAAALIAQALSTITGGYASVLEAISKVVPAFQSSAEEIRSISEAFGESARVNLEKATVAAEGTQAAFWRTVESTKELVGVQSEATTQTSALAGATFELQKTAELTADQLDEMGNGMEYVDGASREAAKGIDTATAAAQNATSDLLAAEGAAIALEQAYKDLGITSQAALTEAAEKARTAFESIRDSGQASARDIKAAFTAYSKAAIEANNGVVSAVIKAEAAQYGLKVEADETGKVIVKSMFEAAQATESVRVAADGAASSFKDVADAAKEAAKETENVKESSGGTTGSGGGTIGSSRGTDFSDLIGQAASVGGEALRQEAKGIVEDWVAASNKASFQGRAQSVRDADAVRLEIDQLIRDAEAENQQTTSTTTSTASQPKPTATQSGLSSPSATYTVNINMGGRTSSINTASDADARQLITTLQDLEART